MAKKTTAAKKTTSKKTTARKTTSNRSASEGSAPKKTAVTYLFSCSLCGREFPAETESAVCDGTIVSTTSDGQIVVTDVNRHSPEAMDRRQ